MRLTFDVSSTTGCGIGFFDFQNGIPMRFLVCAAFLVAASSAAAEIQGPRPSQTACDSKKIGARELADCLRVAADRADKDMAATVEAAVKSIETRAGVLAGQKARWKRSLNETQAQWLAWRDAECQDVAPFEAGLASKGADPKLSCVIDRDFTRTADVKTRYGLP